MEIPDQWPFDQAPNVASVTSTHITKHGLPILIVTHYEDDHSWGFQSGLPTSPADAQIVGMKTIMKIDPSIADVADLLPGWSAVRQDVGGEWKKTRDEWPDAEQ